MRESLITFRATKSVIPNIVKKRNSLKTLVIKLKRKRVTQGQIPCVISPSIVFKALIKEAKRTSETTEKVPILSS